MLAQSDTCHAYQIVSAKLSGLSPQHIIVLNYDDIAADVSNPYPGQVFNHPTAAGTPGIDVYKGCQQDYVRANVTADNFINVLTGTPSWKGAKVLNSTAADDVFVYFTDHGSSGIIAFPEGPYLTSARLNRALKQMYDQKMYKRLVFYLEACESGSMFVSLPKNINVYTTTAANPTESSWGTYCPPDDLVNGVPVGACLGDEYSVNFLEDTDAKGMKQTLQAQYQNVKRLTKKSHVQQYGDLTWTSAPIGEFMSDDNGTLTPRDRPQDGPAHPTAANTVRSRDIKMHTLYYRYLRASEQADAGMTWQTHALAHDLLREVHQRLDADRLFLDLARHLLSEDDEQVARAFTMTPPDQPTDEQHHCFDEVVETVRTSCGGFSDYSLQYARLLRNLCALPGNPPQLLATKIKRYLDSSCQSLQVSG